MCCSDVNQFSIITELLGTPPDDVIETICSENVRDRFLCRHALCILLTLPISDFAVRAEPAEEGACAFQPEAPHNRSRW